MASHYHSSSNTVIPKPDSRALAEKLKNGEINLATVLAQFGALVRETLRVIEEFADEQVKINLDRKNKVDKMDKLINDLSEKCQGMQQALLFKEEKYDEKCREVERYKVICELSAKAAVGDNPYCSGMDENNNGNSHGALGRRDILKAEGQQVDMPPPSNEFSSESQRRNLRSHTKLSHSQMHLSNYVQPLRADSPRSCFTGPPSDDDEDDRRSLRAQYYVGGPCKRKQPSSRDYNIGPTKDASVKERLEIIGGVNVRGPRTNSGPVSVDQLYRPSLNELNHEDSNKRVKIALTGQRNEIMSSSGNVAHQMKQRYTEKDLHRQVAEGCYTRMTGRRKKEWPF